MEALHIREEQELAEERNLSPFAMKSAHTKGRLHPEEKDDIRTDFQRDRDRIIHCKSFRRMKHKTQVFISPVGDHYRTRLTHTLEVSMSEPASVVSVSAPVSSPVSASDSPERSSSRSSIADWNWVYCSSVATPASVH